MLRSSVFVVSVTGTYISINTFWNINVQYISCSKRARLTRSVSINDKIMARVMSKISLDVLVRVENINESGVESLAQRQKWEVWPCNVYCEQYSQNTEYTETDWKFLQKFFTQKFIVQRRNAFRCVETTTPLQADSRLMFRKKWWRLFVLKNVWGARKILMRVVSHKTQPAGESSKTIRGRLCFTAFCIKYEVATCKILSCTSLAE